MRNKEKLMFLFNHLPFYDFVHSFCGFSSKLVGVTIFAVIIQKRPCLIYIYIRILSLKIRKRRYTSTYIVSSRLFNKKNTHATCKYRHNSVDICLELLQAEKPVQKLPAIKPTIREVASLHTT